MFGFSGAIKFYYCPTPLSMRKSFDGLAGAVELESRVVKIALDNPALGQQRVSNELRKEGMFISPGGVRSVWQRHDLETFQKRLKALEAKVAQDGVVLTESQLQALEKAKEEKEAIGEIETEHPGYLIAQDSFYVGNMKGVGRIYQQTVIDTYSKVAFAKLYDRKWIVEVAHSWFNRFRKLLVRYEKSNSSYEALLHLAATVIIYRKLAVI